MNSLLKFKVGLVWWLRLWRQICQLWARPGDPGVRKTRQMTPQSLTSMHTCAISTRPPTPHKKVTQKKIWRRFWSNKFRKPYRLCSLLCAHHILERCWGPHICPSLLDLWDIISPKKCLRKIRGKLLFFILFFCLWWKSLNVYTIRSFCQYSI